MVSLSGVLLAVLSVLILVCTCLKCVERSLAYVDRSLAYVDRALAKTIAIVKKLKRLRYTITEWSPQEDDENEEESDGANVRRTTG